MAENIYETEGDKFLKSGDIEGAIKSYTKAIEQEPNNAKLYLKRAAAEDIEGMADEFFEDYTKATQLAPNTAEFYYAKSHLTYSFGEGDSPSKEEKLEALDYANKAIELDPYYAAVYDWRAFLKKELKDYQGALEDHNKAIELANDYYYFYFFRGETRNKLKDFGGAIEDYSKAIEFNPKFADAYKQRGNLLYKIGDKQSARQDLKKVGKLDKNTTTILVFVLICLILLTPKLIEIYKTTDKLVFLVICIAPIILTIVKILTTSRRND